MNPLIGGILIMIFTAETPSTQRICLFFLLSAERPESKNQKPCGAIIAIVYKIPS